MFTREDLEGHLRLLVERLAKAGARGEVRIVGGAALALRYYERATTSDIDAMILGDDDLLDATVRRIAQERGLPDNWLNEGARQYLPVWGRAIEWHTIYSARGVVVQIASAEALLAMKLHSNRPGRDEKDIARLMSINGVADLTHAETIYEAYYPGDGLSARAVRMVERALRAPAPEIIVPPEVRLTDRRPRRVG